MLGRMRRSKSLTDGFRASASALLLTTKLICSNLLPLISSTFCRDLCCSIRIYIFSLYGSGRR